MRNKACGSCAAEDCKLMKLNHLLKWFLPFCNFLSILHITWLLMSLYNCCSDKCCICIMHRTCTLYLRFFIISCFSCFSKLYKTLMKPILLYGSEYWTMKKKDERLITAELNWFKRNSWSKHKTKNNVCQITLKWQRLYKRNCDRVC